MQYLFLLLLSLSSFSAWGCYDKSASDAQNLSNCTQAAKQGIASAQGTLGALYYAGKGTAQNYTQAEKWFRKAAEQGYAISQQSLGRIYALGNGVTKDLNEAASWYLKAAENGILSAQAQMAVVYITGDGMKLDTIESYKWATIAIANGHKDSSEFRENVAKSMSPEQIAKAAGLAQKWLTAQAK